MARPPFYDWRPLAARSLAQSLQHELAAPDPVLSPHTVRGPGISVVLQLHSRDQHDSTTPKKEGELP